MAKKWWQWLLMYPTLVITIIGAIPQYQNWWQAYKRNVPSKSVQQAIEQEDLWKRNLECTRKEVPHIVRTNRNELLETTACPSGDILVRVQRPDERTVYRWIGFNTFTQVGYFLPDIEEAFAEDRYQNFDLIAQTAPVILCQYFDANGFLVRRMQLPNGQCQEEVINPNTGVVVTVRLAPCTPCH